MVSDSLKANYKEAADLFNKYVSVFGYDTGIKTKKFIEDYMRNNGVEPHTFFLPSDLCYNHTTKPLGDYDGDFDIHLFEYLGRNKYRILGENYPYNGFVIRKKKCNNKEVRVGEWKDGKLIKWDSEKYFEE